MKNGGFKLGWWLVVILFIMAVKDIAQQIPPGRSTAFTTDTYYEHPNEQQIQTRLSGSEAQPLAGGLLDVKNLKVETYETNGLLQVTAKAPQCTYAMLDGTANSDGHLLVVSGDGKYQVEGDGFLFLYKKKSMSLIISNQVHTVIKGGFLLQP